MEIVKEARFDYINLEGISKPIANSNRAAHRMESYIKNLQPDKPPNLVAFVGRRSSSVRKPRRVKSSTDYLVHQVHVPIKHTEHSSPYKNEFSGKKIDAFHIKYTPMQLYPKMLKIKVADKQLGDKF